jgi:hypothetical protein
MKGKMMKKKTMYVAMVACLMFAGVATADPVVYALTVDGDVMGGTITLDLTVAPDESAGGIDTYIYPNAAIVDFSLWQSNTGATLFEPEDIFETWHELTIEVATDDGTPLTFFSDFDDTSGIGSLYGNLDFSNDGEQTFDTQGPVTNVALIVDLCATAKLYGAYTEDEALSIGDTNYDCIVNLGDFALMASIWLDGSGLAELDVMALNWLTDESD